MGAKRTTMPMEDQVPPPPPGDPDEDEGGIIMTMDNASPKSPAEEQVDALARKVLELEGRLKNTENEVAAPQSDDKTIEQGGIPLGVVFLGMWLVAMLICFAAFTDYDADLFNGTNSAAQMLIYGHFQDIHVMVFIGFGFLMTFLRRYGLSAVSFNMMISVYAILWHILVNGFMHCLFHNSWNKITLNLESFILGDFAAACVLITFGGLLGKVTYQQLMIVTFFEVIFFGANFGLAASWVLTPRDQTAESKDNKSSYNSDL